MRKFWTARPLRAPAAVALCLLFSSITAAQYRFDSWTTDNGLPQNGIRQITQTPDGYNGRGFDAGAPDGHHGLGLHGIMERVKILSGKHEIESKKGKGTTVTVEIESVPPAVAGGL